MFLRAPSSVMGAGYRWRGCEAGACTESLGSESGDVVGCDDVEMDRWYFFPAPPPAADGADDKEEDAPALPGADEGIAEPRLLSAAENKKRRGDFPPALPRASGALFMRAERRAGRLILTEVRAAQRDRRVVFRASRDGGRLRLRFASDDDDDDEDDANAHDGGGGGEPEAAGGGGSASGGVAAAPPAPATAAAAQQHSGGGELCQVAAAGAMNVVQVGAVMMGM